MNGNQPVSFTVIILNYLLFSLFCSSFNSTTPSLIYQYVKHP